MRKRSAGILMFRKRSRSIEVFLVHPGGPFWAKKDEGAWSIPKGEYDDNEDALTAARREFYEETGHEADGKFIALKEARQKSGKIIQAWAVEGNIDATKITSNNFEMEWPPRSGKRGQFPEVDRADWYDLETAKRKIISGQITLLEQLEALHEEGLLL